MTPSADYLESSVLRAAGFRHAFFTRLGGVSSGPFESLNFAASVGDEPANVDQNFVRAAAVLALPPERLFFLSQVHGSAVHVLDPVAAPLPADRSSFARHEGDALASRAPGLACGVRTADCVPILAADRRSGAVVAIHAGWRGVVRGVIEAGVAELLALSSGSSPRDLVAAIGPHIGPLAFEVGEDVAQELERASPAAAVVDRTGAKPRVALGRIVRAKLENLGLPGSAIDEVEGCTVSDHARFFSFRRDGKSSGRHYSAIVPRHA